MVIEGSPEDGYIISGPGQQPGDIVDIINQDAETIGSGVIDETGRFEVIIAPGQVQPGDSIIIDARDDSGNHSPPFEITIPDDAPPAPPEPAIENVTVEHKDGQVIIRGEVTNNELGLIMDLIVETEAGLNDFIMVNPDGSFEYSFSDYDDNIIGHDVTIKDSTGITEASYVVTKDRIEPPAPEPPEPDPEEPPAPDDEPRIDNVVITKDGNLVTVKGEVLNDPDSYVMDLQVTVGYGFNDIVSVIDGRFEFTFDASDPMNAGYDVVIEDMGDNNLGAYTIPSADVTPDDEGPPPPPQPRIVNVRTTRDGDNVTLSGDVVDNEDGLVREIMLSNGAGLHAVVVVIDGSFTYEYSATDALMIGEDLYIDDVDGNTESVTIPSRDVIPEAEDDGPPPPPGEHIQDVYLHTAPNGETTLNVMVSESVQYIDVNFDDGLSPYEDVLYAEAGMAYATDMNIPPMTGMLFITAYDYDDIPIETYDQQFSTHV